MVGVAAEFRQGFAKRVPEERGRGWERQWAMGKGEGVAAPMRPHSIYRLGAGEGIQNPPRDGHMGEIHLLEITSYL